MNQRNVLLVDDEPELTFGASLWLRKAGYETRSEHDGRSGINAAIAQTPDAIVMDVRMPKLDGLTALKEMKNNETTCRVPIVMLSASLVDQQVALDNGASFFIKKPFSGKLLVEAVNAAIDQQEKSTTQQT